MKKSNVLITVLLLSSSCAWGISSGPDPDISVDPTIYRFGEVAVGSSSAAVTFTVNNTGSTDLTLGTLSTTGPNFSQFIIGNNSCDNETISAGGSCTLSVTHSRTERGYKHAALSIPIPDNSNTPILEAYLTTEEDLASEAARRLPSVLYAVDIPEIMTAGTTYTLTWTLLGYDDSYKSFIAFFDCTGITAPDCGNGYSSRFETSGALSSVSTTNGEWSYSGQFSTEHHYRYDFTPSAAMFTSNSEVVIRFYSKNANDDAAGQGGLSLIIPGNLADTYYDTSGRRILKTITP